MLYLIVIHIVVTIDKTYYKKKIKQFIINLSKANNL